MLIFVVLLYVHVNVRVHVHVCKLSKPLKAKLQTLEDV